MMKLKMTNDFKKVGIISEAHGLQGEVYIILFSGDNTWIKNIKEVKLKPGILKSDAQEVTFQVKKMKPFKKGFLCSFSSIETRNQAEEYKKFEVWITGNIFISQDGEQPFLIELLGFEVLDLQLGFIGKVDEFSSNGEQDLLVLDKMVNKQKIEIPFIKQFINQVDYKNKKITTTLPKGLLEINEKD